MTRRAPSQPAAPKNGPATGAPVKGGASKPGATRAAAKGTGAASGKQGSGVKAAPRDASGSKAAPRDAAGPKAAPRDASGSKAAPRPAAGGKSPGGPRRRGRPPRMPQEMGYDLPGRIIKRYANRRFYDARLSRCVTIEEIADFVRNGEEVRILDGDTGEDLTKRVLTQIILEEQNRSQLEVFPVEFLRQLIALKGDGMMQWLERYLSAGAQWLARADLITPAGLKIFQEQMETLVPWLRGPVPPREPPVSAAAGGSSGRASRGGDGGGGGTTTRQEEPDLRADVAELQRRLAELTAKMNRR